MKKREIIELKVEDIEFGGEGYGYLDGNKISFKGGIPGQVVRVMIKKIRKTRIEGKILSVINPSPLETEPTCAHFGICGGCTTLSMPYDKQVQMKSRQLQNLFMEHHHKELGDIQVVSCEPPLEYKNKMEFTFGNETKDAPLSLGMHMKNRSGSVTTVDTCMLTDSDYRLILSETVKYFASEQLPFYRIMSHEGYLRHLVVRKGHNTNEILVNLVTTSQMDFDLSRYTNLLLSLPTRAKIVGLLHTVNDSLSDAVICDDLKVLHGEDYFYENLLGVRFKVSPFSFFQTNTRGAEILYTEVLKMLENAEDKNLFDLYSGTGTIGILAAKKVRQVIGIEIIEEAVRMANENCRSNGITNATYLAGDVKDIVSSLKTKPDIIVLDPLRGGMHLKAIEDVLLFGAEEIIYVSCNPKAFAVELNKFKNNGYKVKKVVGVDQFPNTPHVETVALLCRKDIDNHIEMKLELDEESRKQRSL